MKHLAIFGFILVKNTANSLIINISKNNKRNKLIKNSIFWQLENLVLQWQERNGEMPMMQHNNLSIFLSKMKKILIIFISLWFILTLMLTSLWTKNFRSHFLNGEKITQKRQAQILQNYFKHLQINLIQWFLIWIKFIFMLSLINHQLTQKKQW